MTNPWDRQPKEFRSAYEGFIVFRDLGLTRTLAQVAEKLHRPVKTVRNWSARFNWTFRTDHWDAEMEREKERGAREKARKEGEHHELLARSSVNIVSKMMARLNDKMEKEPTYIPSGETVLRLADMAIRLHRLTLGATGEGAVLVVNANAQAGATASVGDLQAEADRCKELIRSWADRLPPALRNEIGRRLDAEFQAVISAQVDRAEQAARALLPPPPIDIRNLKRNGEDGR